MGILSDRQIRKELGSRITPFKDYGPKVPGTISSGLFDGIQVTAYKLWRAMSARED